MSGMAPAARQAPSRARRGRRIGIVIVGAAVLSISAILLVACNSMSIAAWTARPALQEMLGERGEVSVHVIERQINVTPRCDLDLEMHDDVTSVALADVLSNIEGTIGDSTCEVRSVEFAPFSAISAEEWAGVSDEAWAAVAERIRRSTDIHIRRDEDGGWLVGVTSLGEEMADGADAIGAAIAGDPLEPTLGTTRWLMSWRAPSEGAGGYHDIAIEADSTPPAALSDALNSIALIADPLRPGSGDGAAAPDDPVVGVQVVVKIVDGVSNVYFGLTVQDWNLDAMSANETEYLSSSAAASTVQALFAAISESGLEVGSVRAVANDTLSWGDVDRGDVDE